MAVSMLKQRLVHNYLPERLKALDIPVPDSIDALDDVHRRQRLMDRCAKISQRATSDLMTVYIAAAEARFEETQVQFDRDMATFEQTQQRGPDQQKLTVAMRELMERAFQQHNQRLLAIYNYKLRFFAKAPTAAN